MELPENICIEKGRLVWRPFVEFKKCISKKTTKGTEPKDCRLSSREKQTCKTSCKNVKRAKKRKSGSGLGKCETGKQIEQGQNKRKTALKVLKRKANRRDNEWKREMR